MVQVLFGIINYPGIDIKHHETLQVRHWRPQIMLTLNLSIYLSIYGIISININKYIYEHPHCQFNRSRAMLSPGQLWPPSWPSHPAPSWRTQPGPGYWWDPVLLCKATKLGTPYNGSDLISLLDYNICTEAPPLHIYFWNFQVFQIPSLIWPWTPSL